jgi:oligoribonuclease NrnB/cAMP/cGMP phosphodiesterase (DHH superfamily)
MAGEYRYDITHSAAVLAWNYFYPGKPVPRLLRHIEDEDIWTFKLAHTAAVNARMELVDFNFAAWDKIIRAFEKPAARAAFIKEGALLAAYRARMVGRFIEENAVPVRFLKYSIFAVNSMRPFTSEIGHRLCDRRPPLAIVWHENRNGISVSLRSDGTVDVSKIAARFGGGGHKAAASFRLPRDAKKPWRYEKPAAKGKKEKEK